MRLCLHLNRDTRCCSLGLDVATCSTCSMFQFPSRYSSQQAVVKTAKTIGSVLVSKSSNVGVESRVLQSVAVKGGCSCRKNR